MFKCDTAPNPCHGKKTHQGLKACSNFSFSHSHKFTIISHKTCSNFNNKIKNANYVQQSKHFLLIFDEVNLGFSVIYKVQRTCLDIHLYLQIFGISHFIHFLESKINNLMLFYKISNLNRLYLLLSI
jgi:hypothetical protein